MDKRDKVFNDMFTTLGKELSAAQRLDFSDRATIARQRMNADKAALEKAEEKRQRKAQKRLNKAVKELG